MRNTLVFKGVKVSDKESWKDTENNLVEKIKSIVPDVPKNVIERCHRSAKSNDNKPRHIVAQFHSWKDADYIRQEFAKANAKDKKFQIYCSQKYGPMTTHRRNEAMKLWRELLSKKEIAKAYVA